MASNDADYAERLAEHRKTFSPITRLRTNVRNFVVETHRLWLVKFWGMEIGEGSAISLDAKLDKAHPRGIHIGKNTAVNFGAAVLSHDYIRSMRCETRIGDRCQIGAHSIIFPGVSIGDGCIIAAGSVVMRDVPAGSLVFGNPARVMEQGIITGKWGKILGRASKEDPAKESPAKPEAKAAGAPAG